MSSTPAADGRKRASGSRIAELACSVQAPYQAAVFRIGLATVVIAFLLREWPHRRVLFGDRSPLSYEMAVRLAGDQGGFTVLGWWDGRLWFEIVYALTLVTALAVMLGWRTRTMSVLFLIGVLSLENRNSMVGDGGDNLIRIMVIYLVFTRCADVWSLDARRTARTACRRAAGDSPPDRTGIALWSLCGLLLFGAFGFQGGWPLVFWLTWAAHGAWYAVRRAHPEHEARAVLDACSAMLHNCALLVIAAQICLVYATSGWYKIQGSRWQEGSALHYVLQLDYFTPWPALSEALASAALPVLVLSYLTVMVQVAFPFTLLNRRVKNVLLAVLIVEHLGIAVLLGIPFLSLAMIACDAVFLPTAFLMRLGDRCSRLRQRMWRPVRARAMTRRWISLVPSKMV